MSPRTHTKFDNRAILTTILRFNIVIALTLTTLNFFMFSALLIYYVAIGLNFVTAHLAISRDRIVRKP